MICQEFNAFEVYIPSPFENGQILPADPTAMNFYEVGGAAEFDLPSLVGGDVESRRSFKVWERV